MAPALLAPSERLKLEVVIAHNLNPKPLMLGLPSWSSGVRSSASSVEGSLFGQQTLPRSSCSFATPLPLHRDCLATRLELSEFLPEDVADHAIFGSGSTGGHRGGL
jgi:hypothetical protein